MTLHYHGTPISPMSVFHELAGRCFCVSFAQTQDIVKAHEFGQSVMLDNGAFTAWKKGRAMEWAKYYAWCEQWLHWQTTWAVIPDVIDGVEFDNDKLVRDWPHGVRGAPVWHLHESLDRLRALCDRWPRVCLGSSAEFSIVGNQKWRARMNEAMDAICREGRVPTWLHMLRGMNAARLGYPFASVDSTDIARNHNRGVPVKQMADRWDSIQCKPFWSGAA